MVEILTLQAECAPRRIGHVHQKHRTGAIGLSESLVDLTVQLQTQRVTRLRGHNLRPLFRTGLGGALGGMGHAAATVEAGSLSMASVGAVS
jgi:hypothetical protein